MTSFFIVDYPKALKHVKENNITDCIIISVFGGKRVVERNIEKATKFFEDWLSDKDLVFFKDNKFADHSLIRKGEVPKSGWDVYVLLYLQDNNLKIFEVNYSPNGTKDCNTCEDRILKETIKILKEDFNYKLKIKETK